MIRNNLMNNVIDVRMNYCIHHGFTAFYKNGKCKECVKYQRLQTRLYNRKNSSLNT